MWGDHDFQFLNALAYGSAQALQRFHRGNAHLVGRLAQADSDTHQAAAGHQQHFQIVFEAPMGFL